MVEKVNPYVFEPFGASAFHLLAVIDFLCLAAGTYLLLILHDRENRNGHLLMAAGFAVLALQIIPEHLVSAAPVLRYAGTTLSLAVAGVLIVWGTLALVEADRPPEEGGRARRALLIIAATLTIIGTVFVWALPFVEPLRAIIGSAGDSSAFMTFQRSLRVGVAAALFACMWITWERRLLGDDISRMFGAAFVCWGASLLFGLTDVLTPEKTSWLREGIGVIGSLFVGNALVLHVYQAERTAAERQRRLEFIDRVTSAAIEAPRLMPMLEAAAKQLRTMLGARLTATYLVDSDDRDTLRRVFETQSSTDLPEELTREQDHAVIEALKLRRPVQCTLTLGEDEGEPAEVPGVAVPLMGVARSVGVLVVGGQPETELTDDDLLTLGNAGAQLGVIVQQMVLLEDVQQARDRWQQTFDSITELVTVHDAQGRITAANQAALQFAGVSEHEAVGRSLCELLGPECHKQEEMLTNCVRTGEPPETDTHRVRGHVHEVQVTPLRDDRKTIAGCVRVAHDVTSRWRAEERLAQSERRYRELAESANDVIYTHDLAGNLLYINPAGVRMLGYSQEELSHLSFWDIVAPESMARVRTYVANLLAGKPQDEQTELRMLCDDGRVVVVQLRANVLKREGQNEAVHGIARDVTAEKQLTTQLIQADRLASVGTLIAGVAHELNNPLTAIGGYAEMLASRPHDESDTIAIATIAEQAGRCRDVARNLLNFARQTEDRVTDLDLNALISGVCDLRAYDLRAARIDVRASYDAELPRVVGQYGQLQQVIYNLVDNACYAMQGVGGALEVATWCDGESVYVRVADTGPGIPEQIVRRVFEPFVTSKPRGEGTGLGLSICRRILEDHGGQIEAHNRPGGGAAFVASLPAAGECATAQAGTDATREDAPQVEHAPEVEDAQTPVGAALSSPAKVLFIDDEPSLCALVNEYLSRLGHEVHVEATGEAGLETALAGDFDAIICDMRLPGISGEDVCMALLEHKPSAAERMVVATGDILSPQTQSFFDRTGLPHIHKPFKLDELQTAIAELIDGRPVRGG